MRAVCFILFLIFVCLPGSETVKMRAMARVTVAAGIMERAAGIVTVAALVAVRWYGMMIVVTPLGVVCVKLCILCNDGVGRGGGVCSCN